MSSVTLEAGQEISVVLPPQEPTQQELLLELSPALLADLTEQGCGTLLIKGASSSDEALLCTDTATYSLSKLETSNALFLVPPFDLQSGEIKVSEQPLSSHLEARQTAPRWQTLLSLLPRIKCNEDLRDQESMSEEPSLGLETQYSGRIGLHFEDILFQVQASSLELRNELKRIRSFEQDSRWSILDPDYEDRIADVMISTIVEADWNFSQLSVEKCCQALVDFFPRPIVSHWLLCHSLSSVESHISLDLDSIKKERAMHILRKQEEWLCDEFFTVLNKKLLPSAPATISVLGGIACTLSRGGFQYVRKFFSSDLPLDPYERFQILFEAKPKFPVAEIIPFLEDICGKNITVQSLLQQHARLISPQNENAYYITRHII